MWSRWYLAVAIASVFASVSHAQEDCRNVAVYRCANGGQCDETTGRCKCPNGYGGILCNTCSTFGSRGRLDLSSVQQNNLGGQGPDTGEPVLTFERVAKTSKTKTVDLQIRAITAYQSLTLDSNGVGSSPQFGQISVTAEVTASNKGRVDTMLNFEFLDSDTQAQAQFDFFTFGMFDLDKDEQQKEQEVVCLNLDELIAVTDTNIPGLKLQGEAGELKAEAVAPRKYPDAGLVPGFKDEQLLSTYDPSKTCGGSSGTRLGSVHVFANQVGFACASPTLAFEAVPTIVPCDKCFDSSDCPAGRSKFFGPVYAQGSDEAGQTCDSDSDPDCTATHGINTASRSLTIGFPQASSFQISIGIQCDKPVGQTCTRNFVFGGLLPDCVICDDGFEPDGTGLCKVICRAPKYIDGKLCKECPSGHSCDGTNANKCPETNYMDGNECKPCPSGRICDGTTSSKCSHPSYIVENNVCVCPKNTYLGNSQCLECPSGKFYCDGKEAKSCNPPRYVDNNECKACPRAHTCDGGDATECLAPKYVAGNSCVHCIEGHTCDGAQATRCFPPKYISNNKCIDCILGYTCDGISRTKCNAPNFVENNVCKACREGSVCDGTRARDCEGDTYARDNKCEPCPLGKMCAGGVAKECAKPKYLDKSGECKSCPRCYNCDGAEPTRVCVTCPSDDSLGYERYFDLQLNKCERCPTGYTCNGNDKKLCKGPKYVVDNVCGDCPSERYISTDQVCEACPVGSVCDGKKAETCKKTEYIASNKCQACEAGYTCDGVKREKCAGSKYITNNKCVNCPSTRYINGGVCEACPRANVCDGKTSTPCAKTQYVVSNKCENCPEQYSCDGAEKRYCESPGYIEDNVCVVSGFYWSLELDIADLRAFQVIITYDAKSIKPVSVTAGDAWSGNLFESTLFDPVGKILVIGSQPDATIPKDKKNLAVVHFKYVAAIHKTPTAIIVETLVKDGLMLGERNRDLKAPATLSAVSPRKTCDEPVPGDTNADCLFTVSDLYFIQLYVKDSSSFEANDAQKKAMDADFNGKIEKRDVYFIRRALAKKFRHMITKPEVTVSNCNVQVETSLSGTETEYTNVILDVSIKNQESKKTVIMRGTTQGGNTQYTASVKVSEADNVHVAFSVETRDKRGQTDSRRLFPWQGALEGVAGSDQPEPLFDRAITDSECKIVPTDPPTNPPPVQSKYEQAVTTIGQANNQGSTAKKGGSSGGLIGVAAVLGLILVAAIVVGILYIKGLFCFAAFFKTELLVIVPKGSSVHDGHSLDEKGRLRILMSSDAKVDAVADAIINAFRDLPVSIKEKTNHLYPFRIRRVNVCPQSGSMSVIPVDGQGNATLPFDQTLEDLHVHNHAILELVGLTNVMFIVPHNCGVKQHRHIDNSIDDHPRISLVTSPTMDVAMLKDHIKDAVDGLPKKFDIAIWPGDDNESAAKKLPGRGSTLLELQIGNATTVMTLKYTPEVQVLKEGYTEEL